MGLRRVLGPVDATWLVVGNMIGAGIFVTPGLVAGHLRGAAWIILAWMLGGVLALCGAMVYAEMGARLPRAGGDYRYLHQAFGPLPAFLSGWAAFLLTFSAAAAAMSMAAVDHLGQAWPRLADMPAAASSAAAAFLILVLTAANAAGSKIAGRTTIALTALPLAGLLALFVTGWSADLSAIRWPDHPFATPAAAWPVALGAAMVPVFWTYSGWNAAAYLGGEVREPRRNLPRALLAGTLTVTVIYVVVNTILLVSLPGDTMAASDTAVAEAARRLLGPTAERLLSLVIALAIIGSANVTLMAGARIYYAMAGDGILPGFLGRTNRAGVPGAALWMGGVWTMLLAATGSFGRLVAWSGLAILLLSSLAVAGLFVLRRQGEPAPFRCPGYPLTPGVYLVASLGVAVASFLYDPWSSFWGLLLVLAGVPVYFLLGLRRHLPGRP